MAEPIISLSSPSVRIVSRAFDSWNVEFRIDVGELLDQKVLLHHLRGIKQEIAQTQSVPENCLIFDGIVRKTRKANCVDVIVRIKKKIVEKGNPHITFTEAVGPDETHYSHMTALLDIMYLDDFERVVTHDRIMQAIREGRLKPDLVDHDLVVRKLHEVLETQAPCRNVPIAEGHLPEIGSDAEIEFFFQAVVEPNTIDQYCSSRRVHRGDVLCRKTPPTAGKENGINVLGEILNPREGLDIDLQAGANAILSLDGSEIIADGDGVAAVTRQTHKIMLLNGVKEFPKSVAIKVNPILQLNGNEIFDVATNSAVEVIGNLRIGSRILTDSEVFISGDVEAGSTIDAADEIIVAGNVSGASLSSQKDIFVKQDVENSQITASNRVTISGQAKDSTIIGDEVHAESVKGGKILARKQITLARIEADEGNVLSTLCVGMDDYFLQRLRDNQDFLEIARTNLERIEMVVGPDIMEQIHSSNTQVMVMRLLARLRNETGSLTRKQVEIYRKLVEAIPPTRALVEQKERESVELADKLRDQGKADENLIIIRERIAGRAIVSIKGTESMIGPENGGAEITREGEKLLINTRDGQAQQ